MKTTETQRNAKSGKGAGKKNVLSPYLLCVLRASAVKNSTLPYFSLPHILTPQYGIPDIIFGPITFVNPTGSLFHSHTPTSKRELVEGV